MKGDIPMPYKEFQPRDTLEEALSKLWGAAQEFIPTTRLEEIICMIANAQPTGGGGVPDIGDSDVGKVLTAGEDGAVWASGGGESPVTVVTINWVEDTGTMSKTWQEIYNDISDGKIVGILDVGEMGATCQFIMSCSINSESYEVYVSNLSTDPIEVYVYTADSANGYPSITD